jgi:hypothetical protein
MRRDIDLNREPEESQEASSSDHIPVPGDSHGERCQGHGEVPPVQDVLRDLIAPVTTYQEPGEFSRQAEASRVEDVLRHPTPPFTTYQEPGEFSRQAESHWHFAPHQEAYKMVSGRPHRISFWEAWQSQALPRSTDLQQERQEAWRLHESSSSQQPDQPSHPSRARESLRAHFETFGRFLLPHGPSLPSLEKEALVRQHQDEILLSRDEGPSSPASDASNGPGRPSSSFSQERDQKRKRDEASSQIGQAALEYPSSSQNGERVSRARHNAKRSEIIEKRKRGEELTEKEQRIYHNYKETNARHNAKRSEIIRKRNNGEELTEEEMKIYNSYNDRNARKKAKRSEIIEKIKRDEELIEEEKQFYNNYKDSIAKRSKKRSEIIEKRKRGEELTEEEKQFYNNYKDINARHNARKNAKRSEIIEKRKRGEELTEEEMKIYNNYKDSMAKSNKKD